MRYVSTRMRLAKDIGAKCATLATPRQTTSRRPMRPARSSLSAALLLIVAIAGCKGEDKATTTTTVAADPARVLPVDFEQAGSPEAGFTMGVPKGWKRLDPVGDLDVDSGLEQFGRTNPKISQERLKETFDKLAGGARFLAVDAESVDGKGFARDVKVVRIDDPGAGVATKEDLESVARITAEVSGDTSAEAHHVTINDLRAVRIQYRAYAGEQDFTSVEYGSPGPMRSGRSRSPRKTRLPTWSSSTALLTRSGSFELLSAPRFAALRRDRYVSSVSTSAHDRPYRGNARQVDGSWVVESDGGISFRSERFEDADARWGYRSEFVSPSDLSLRDAARRLLDHTDVDATTNEWRDDVAFLGPQKYFGQQTIEPFNKALGLEKREVVATHGGYTTITTVMYGCDIGTMNEFLLQALGDDAVLAEPVKGSFRGVTLAAMLDRYHFAVAIGKGSTMSHDLYGVHTPGYATMRPAISLINRMTGVARLETPFDAPEALDRYAPVAEVCDSLSDAHGTDLYRACSSGWVQQPRIGHFIRMLAKRLEVDAPASSDIDTATQQTMDIHRRMVVALHDFGAAAVKSSEPSRPDRFSI